MVDKYTQGKWEVCKTPLGYFGIMIDGRLVADVNTDKTKADATLMASSKDMYEALRVIEYVISVDKSELSNHPVAIQIVREALAKAEGK